MKLDLSSSQKEFERFCFPCNQILNSDKWEEGLFNAVDQDKFQDATFWMRLRNSSGSESNVSSATLMKSSRFMVHHVVLNKGYTQTE